MVRDQGDQCCRCPPEKSLYRWMRKELGPFDVDGGGCRCGQVEMRPGWGDRQSDENVVDVGGQRECRGVRERGPVEDEPRPV